MPCDDPEWSNFTKFFAQNFERFGIKKLISTSYACAAKGPAGCDDYCPTLFETNAKQYDSNKTETHGKIFTLTHDTNQNGRIDIEDLEWDYLQGDGDFRSDEVKALRDEADIIITNPPFSQFRDFLAWIIEANKQFLIIGNMNAITYKEVFPLIKGNKVWLGTKKCSGGMDMIYDQHLFDASQVKKYTLDTQGNYIINIMGVIWFTNIEHGRRHQPLQLMTMADNIKFSRHKEIRNQEYQKYDNYDAIEIPFSDAIPSDYDGVMGVPITFLDKYCPEQFEILGMCENENLYGLKTKIYTTAECKKAYMLKFHKSGTYDLNASGVLLMHNMYEKVYQRILIRKKKGVQ